MVQLFVQRGMDRYDADDVIRTMAKYKVRVARACRAARVSEARGCKCRAPVAGVLREPDDDGGAFAAAPLARAVLSAPERDHVRHAPAERRAAPRTEPRRLAGLRRSSLSASRRCSSSPSDFTLA